jgi:F420-dependent oxidoreductase-like protein
MDIAIMIEGQMGLHWARWKAMAQVVEASGYAGLYRSDHFTNPSPPDQDSLELWTSLTWLASHTKRIEFGPLVAPFTFRHPSNVARMASAVDELSNGRLQLGLGAGWQEREHHNYGFYLGNISERIQRFEEGLEVVTRLFNEDEANFQGDFFQIEEAVLRPKSRNGTGSRIVIGGNGMQRTLKLAARFADEWNGVFLPVKEFKKRNLRLDELLKKEGRDSTKFRRSLMMGCMYAKNEELANKMAATRGANSAKQLRDEGFAAGSAPSLIEHLKIYEEAGCQRVMLQWLRLDDLEGVQEMGEMLNKEFQG